MQVVEDKKHAILVLAVADQEVADGDGFRRVRLLLGADFLKPGVRLKGSPPASQSIECPVARDGKKPRLWIVDRGKPAALTARDYEGLLEKILGLGTTARDLRQKLTQSALMGYEEPLNLRRLLDFPTTSPTGLLPES